MKRLSLLLTIGLGALALGCRGDIAGEGMSKLKTFRDKVCACMDVACSEQAEKAFEDWGHANEGEIKKANPSESFSQEFRKILREVRDCQDKLKEAAHPKEPPPATEPPLPPLPAAVDPAAPPAATP